MPPKKYLDFVESTPFVRIAKQHAKGEHDVRRYVTITCPYCAIEFVEITVDSLPTNKASECKKHLLRCESASAVGVCTEPVKRKRVVTGVESMDEGLCVERATNAALIASEARLIASLQKWHAVQDDAFQQLDGVLHSINEAGTTLPTDRWYGSEAVVDRWLAAESRTELRSLLVRDERFFQLTVREGGAGGELIGRSLGDLQFPSGALLALVKRKGEAFVPSSRDVVQEYDRLTIIGNPDAVQTLRQRFSVDEEPDAEAE